MTPEKRRKLEEDADRDDELGLVVRAFLETEDPE